MNPVAVEIVKLAENKRRAKDLANSGKTGQANESTTAVANEKDRSKHDAISDNVGYNASERIKNDVTKDIIRNKDLTDAERVTNGNLSQNIDLGVGKKSSVDKVKVNRKVVESVSGGIGDVTSFRVDDIDENSDKQDEKKKKVTHVTENQLYDARTERKGIGTEVDDNHRSGNASNANDVIKFILNNIDTATAVANDHHKTTVTEDKEHNVYDARNVKTEELADGADDDEIINKIPGNDVTVVMVKNLANDITNVKQPHENNDDKIINKNKTRVGDVMGITITSSQNEATTELKQLRQRNVTENKEEDSVYSDRYVKEELAGDDTTVKNQKFIDDVTGSLVTNPQNDSTGNVNHENSVNVTEDKKVEKNVYDARNGKKDELADDGQMMNKNGRNGGEEDDEQHEHIEHHQHHEHHQPDENNKDKENGKDKKDLYDARISKNSNGSVRLKLADGQTERGDNLNGTSTHNSAYIIGGATPDGWERVDIFHANVINVKHDRPSIGRQDVEKTNHSSHVNNSSHVNLQTIDKDRPSDVTNFTDMHPHHDGIYRKHYNVKELENIAATGRTDVERATGRLGSLAELPNIKTESTNHRGHLQDEQPITDKHKTEPTNHRGQLQDKKPITDEHETKPTNHRGQVQDEQPIADEQGSLSLTVVVLQPRPNSSSVIDPEIFDGTSRTPDTRPRTIDPRLNDIIQPLHSSTINPTQNDVIQPLNPTTIYPMLNDVIQPLHPSTIDSRINDIIQPSFTFRGNASRFNDNVNRKESNNHEVIESPITGYNVSQKVDRMKNSDTDASEKSSHNHNFINKTIVINEASINNNNNTVRDVKNYTHRDVNENGLLLDGTTFASSIHKNTVDVKIIFLNVSNPASNVFVNPVNLGAGREPTASQSGERNAVFYSREENRLSGGGDMSEKQTVKPDTSIEAEIDSIGIDDSIGLRLNGDGEFYNIGNSIIKL